MIINYVYIFNRMPFTEAVILETHRHCSVLPLGMVDELLNDVEDFNGYSLPKGLPLIANTYQIHHSKETWKDPEAFRPERFIENPDLKENIVTFQPGKRTCPGEHVVRDFMFLMVTEWFQKLKIDKHPDVSEEMNFDGHVGFVIVPKTLPIRVMSRIF